ncbi:ATP-dependent RNA helicase DDX24 [Myxocyprinus asiaticus]|uniref:ATP-dependent RNA helicase DDX24 n=1 Tax=Myxocyprinus asiaticus TaxID=70543 RepID=UPI00222239CA|nr:ATP-dependent RNA helicase DDX24 [Myxocyprinus asiaticus]
MKHGRAHEKMKIKKSRGKKLFVSSKRGIVVKGKWKAVNVDPSLFSDDGGLEGLVCFEELTDYSLVEPENTITADESVKDRKKRKATEHHERKKKLKKDETSSDVSTADQTVAVDMLQEDPADQTLKTPPQTSQKEDKKKRRKKKKTSTEAAEVIAPSRKKMNNWTTAAVADAGHQSADVSAWKDLFVPADVLKALSKLGFSAPTPIQALALPPAIRDHLDVLGAAETGSGKTLCFGIPMIHMILEWREKCERKDECGKSDRGAHVQSDYLPAVIEQTDTCDQTSHVTHTNSEVVQEESGETEQSHDPDEDVCDDDDDDDDGVNDVKCKETPLLGLVLTPTRELAVQVKHHIDAAAQFTGIKTAIVVGGMAPQKQKRMLMRRPEIVIATPGRLWEMIKDEHPHLQNLRQLRCLVIDEADRMVERGHFAELENLLEMLNTSQFNPKRQTFVFSATLTMVHSLPLRVQQKKSKRKEQRSKLQLLMEKVGIKDKPKIIDLTRREATVETLTETRINCTKEEKDLYLYYFLLQYPGRTMVFANSIDCIKRLSALLLILDCDPLPLHANMHQKQRLKNLERFAEKDSCILLTTDVAARGLDIPNVQHVIHYQVPRTSEIYVHRSGRTARATKEGLSLLLIGPDDLMNFKKICRTLEKDEDLPVFPVQTKCMMAIKERVNLARKIEKIEYFNSREKQHNSWVRQAAEAMDIDVDDDLLLGGRKDENDEREQQKLMKVLKKQLKHLISQPVFRNEMKTKYPTQMGKLQLPQLPISTADTALTSVTNHRQTLKHKR